MDGDILMTQRLKDFPEAITDGLKRWMTIHEKDMDKHSKAADKAQIAMEFCAISDWQVDIYCHPNENLSQFWEYLNE